MDTWFPTFRRWLGIQVPFPSLWPPGHASWGQRQSLLRLIALATEENLPLSPLVEAWAADESGAQKRRLYRLANLLEAGTPLPDAVEGVRGVLSDEKILAIRFGAQSGTLAATLRDVLDESQPPRVRRFPQLQRAFVYFFCLILVAAFIVTFIQIRIVPEFNKIMDEFSIAAPEMLKWSVRFGYFMVNYWYVWTLLIIVLAWLTFSAWPGRRLRNSILGRLFRPLRELRTADVLRKLSVATQAGRPIPGAISTLARYHFDPTLRHQLLFIRNEMEQGADVWQSLAAIGLLSPPEVRVLETAGRVGNRPWALKQLAVAKQRRTIRRLTQWSKLVLPGLVLLMGAFVLFQALSVFGPLVRILTSLL